MKIKELLFALLVPAFLIGCDSDKKSEHTTTTCTATTYNANTYQAAKVSLADQEKSNPKKFVAVTDLKNKKNLIGQWVIEGNISNKATIISFKEIDLKASFYDKDDVLLGTKEIPVEQVINPGTDFTFKVKTDGYKGAKTMDVVYKNVVIVPASEEKKIKDSLKKA